MDIITYCSKNYEWVFKKFVNHWRSHCSNIYVYTDDFLEINQIKQIKISKLNNDWKRNTFNKILAFQNHLSFKKNFVFLDSDCLVKEKLDHVFCRDFSIAVTGDKNFVNSGVLFCKFCDESKKIIEEWRKQAEEIYEKEKFAEQKSLLNLLKSKRYNFLELPMEIYNSYVGFHNNFSKEEDHKKWIKIIKNKSKIVHFQGLGHFDRFYDIDNLIKKFVRWKLYI